VEAALTETKTHSAQMNEGRSCHRDLQILVKHEFQWNDWKSENQGATS